MKKKIALLGEILVDMVVEGEALVRPCPGGSLYNTASSLAKMGAGPRFYSLLGEDLWGSYLRDRIIETGLDGAAVRASRTNKTMLAFAKLDAHGNASYDFYRTEIPEVLDFEDFPDVGIFHFGSLFAVFPENRESVRMALQAAWRNQCLVSYDPNYRPSCELFQPAYHENLRIADIIKLSYEDAGLLLGTTTIDGAFERLEEFKAPLVIITLGDQGVVARLSGQRPVRLTGTRVQVVDTIGAGDNFSAGYLYYLAENQFHDKASLAAMKEDQLTEMLSFASAVAVEALKVKGASVSVQRLQEVRSRYFT